MREERERQILRYVARDLEAVVLSQMPSQQGRFLVGAMGSLLKALADDRPDDAVGSPPVGLAAALMATVARRPDSAGAREAAYRQSGSGTREEGVVTDGPLTPVTAAQLEAYFRDSGRYGTVRDLKVEQAPGGFSKETFLISFGSDGREQRIVLRRDPAFSPLNSTVSDEYPLLCALADHDLAVPAMLWAEADPRPFGAPVVAMARIDGSADVARWTGDPAVARSVVDQAAALLARLHGPEALAAYPPGRSIPGANGDTPGEMVRDLRRYWSDMAQGHALVDAVFDWLEDNAPPHFARRARLHGDFGFHNLLVDDGRIAGLLDWEFSHVGDVAEDLAYARPFIEQVLSWAEFEQLYRAHGGPEVDPGAIHFWGVFGLLRIGLGCFATLGEIDRANPRLDAKASYVAVSFAEPFVIDAAKLALGPDQGE